MPKVMKMHPVEMFQKLFEYNYAMTRRVWDSIDQITEKQFLQDDAYSRGSIRNLMAHLLHTDRRWLTGLKNLPDIRGQLKKYEEYLDRASLRADWEEVARDMTEYLDHLTDTELFENPAEIPAARWQVLLHVANHGTDHRATILQKLHEFGAPTFDQDFVLWLWGR